MQNMLVGIKPTVGRISRYGVIPITADQDTAGPMARSVTDARDHARRARKRRPIRTTRRRRTCTPPPGRDYRSSCALTGLRGKRIGIPRAIFYDPFLLPGGTAPSGRPHRAADRDHERGHRRAQGARRHRRRSREHPERDRSGSRQQQPAAGDVRRLQSDRRELLDRVQVRLQARFRSLPSVPRIIGACQIAHRTAAVQYRERGQQRDPISPGSAGHVRRDGPDDRPRPVSARPRKGHPSSPTRTACAKRSRSTTSTRCCSPGRTRPRSPRAQDFRPLSCRMASFRMRRTHCISSGLQRQDQPFGVGFTGLDCSEPGLIEIAYAVRDRRRRSGLPPSATP